MKVVVNNEIRIFDNSIIGIYLDIKFDVFLLIIFFNVLIIILIVEKFVNEIKNVVIIVWWCGV